MHNRNILRMLFALVLLFLLVCPGALAEIVSRNPLLTPPVISEYTQTEDEFLHILLLGIDGGDTYNTSGGKKKLEDCHTDGVIVASINKTQGKISLVSIPRDSLTYVPGIRGIYKFNGAINCADTLEEGFKLACDAASWHLGGIEITKYIAIDATALVALGDAIGGVDFEVDARFGGSNGKWYNAGMQHLDGTGIMDYMRVRKAATKDYNDLGRTKRQRAMMKAIFAKIKQNPSLAMDVLKVYQSGELNIFSNISIINALTLIPTVLALDLENVSTHVLEGKYQTFMKNFTFNDQDVRLQVLRDVYGLEAEPMPYVSYKYSKWLTEAGLTTAKYINLARAVLEHAKAQSGAAEHADYKSLDEAIDACILAFDQAADTTTDADTNAMIKARNALKPTVEQAAKTFKYPDKIKWGRNDYWYNEPLINERWLNWN